MASHGRHLPSEHESLPLESQQRSKCANAVPGNHLLCVRVLRAPFCLAPAGREIGNPARHHSDGACLPHWRSTRSVGCVCGHNRMHTAPRRRANTRGQCAESLAAWGNGVRTGGPCPPSSPGSPGSPRSPLSPRSPCRPSRPATPGSPGSPGKPRGPVGPSTPTAPCGAQEHRGRGEAWRGHDEHDGILLLGAPDSLPAGPWVPLARAARSPRGLGPPPPAGRAVRVDPATNNQRGDSRHEMCDRLSHRNGSAGQAEPSTHLGARQPWEAGVAAVALLSDEPRGTLRDPRSVSCSWRPPTEPFTTHSV